MRFVQPPHVLTANESHQDDFDTIGLLPDTLIVTPTGPVPIAELRTGDLVLTHQRRWRPIVHITYKLSTVVRVTTAEHTAGIGCTPAQAFLVGRDSAAESFDPAASRLQAWIAAHDLSCSTDRLFVPCGLSIDSIVLPHAAAADVPHALGWEIGTAWWIVGRWLRDGYATFAQRDTVELTCDAAEVTALARVLRATGAPWEMHQRSQVTRFALRDGAVRSWLLGTFGLHPVTLRLPSWMLAMPHAWRSALMEGVWSTAHMPHSTTLRLVCRSNRLALGLWQLALSVGHPSRLAVEAAVKQSDRDRVPENQWLWTIVWDEQAIAPSTDEDIQTWLSVVNSVINQRDQQPVVGLTVADDASCIADGCVVAAGHAPSADIVQAEEP